MLPMGLKTDRNDKSHKDESRPENKKLNVSKSPDKPLLSPNKLDDTASSA